MRPGREHGLVLVALTLALAGGCPDRLTSTRGCSFDEECARSERCVGGVCVDKGASEDAGPVDDAGVGPTDAGADVDAGTDAGPSDGGLIDDAGSPVDAGPMCTQDNLGNESGETPHAIEPDGTALDGRLCPGGDEYFGFFGFSGDPIQVVATWGVDKDLDLALVPPGAFDPGDASPGDSIGVSVHPRMEVTTRSLASTGQHMVRLYPIGAVDVAGIDYVMQIRSGLPCRTDAGCGPSERCLMPVWTSTNANGVAPPDAVVFVGGLCGAPYAPCSVELADNAAAEGVSHSRTEAYTVLPANNVWSCQFDEDWFRTTMPQTGELVISFTNKSPTPGTFLVAAFDANGNLLGGAGYDALPVDQLRTVVIPFLKQGAVVDIRVFQLGVDDLGLYSISVESFAGSCAGPTDCDATATRKYGRTQCRTGACECPDPNVCTPPG